MFKKFEKFKLYKFKIYWRWKNLFYSSVNFFRGVFQMTRSRFLFRFLAALLVSAVAVVALVLYVSRVSESRERARVAAVKEHIRQVQDSLKYYQSLCASEASGRPPIKGWSFHPDSALANKKKYDAYFACNYIDNVNHFRFLRDSLQKSLPPE